MNEQIIAVDFDGTLCENKWPEIGEPNTNYGKLLSAMPQEYLNREIKEVTSSGGWTRMDYILTLK